MPDIRRLVPGEEAMLDVFLKPHTASSMILRSNLHRAGLAYEGKTSEGIYIGVFLNGDLLGVAAHTGIIICWSRHRIRYGAV